MERAKQEVGTHWVWPEAETAFVPASVVTKPAVHAVLREGFENFFFNLRMWLEIRRGRGGWGEYTGWCWGLECSDTSGSPPGKFSLSVPLRTQRPQRMGSKNKETGKGSGVREIWLQGLNEIEL